MPLKWCIILEEKKKTLIFLVRLSSEEHNVGDDVRKKVETPSNFLWLSSHSFSRSHFTWTLKDDVLYFLTVPKLAYVMKPSPLFSESWEFPCLFHFLGTWELQSVETAMSRTTLQLSRTPIKVSALGLKRGLRSTKKLRESAGCQKIWTGFVLLNFVNVALLAGSMEKKLPPQLLAEPCWCSWAKQNCSYTSFNDITYADRKRNK